MSRGGAHLPKVVLLVFVAVVVALRLIMAASLELSPDEAYYWRWSRSFALSYRDHPPLVAWVIRLGTEIFGHSALGVRFSGVVFSAVAVFLVYRIARDVAMRRRDAAVAAVLSSMLIAPASAALIMTPDTPLGLFWLIAILSLVRLATAGSPVMWYVLGVGLGGAILAKHSGLLILPLAMITTTRSHRMREALKTPHPWLGLGMAVALASLYLIPEARSGFPACGFQMRHLLGRIAPGVDGSALSGVGRIGELLAGQLGLLTPVTAVWAFWFCLARGKRSETDGIVWGFLMPIGATAVAALFTHPEQNWAALGHPLGAVLALLMIRRRYREAGEYGAGRRRIWTTAIVATTTLVTLVVHIHALHPFLPLPPARDPVSRLHGWSGLAAVRNDLAAADAVVCDNYGLASQVAWQLNSAVGDMEIRSPDRQPLPPDGDWLLLDETGDWGNAGLAVSCKSIAPLPPLVLRRWDGAVVRRIVVSIGFGCVGKR
jgi:4-amino-4-deoxy-L-arabinose transferase-like glycosyltransferase